MGIDALREFEELETRLERLSGRLGLEARREARLSAKTVWPDVFGVRRKEEGQTFLSQSRGASCEICRLGKRLTV